MAVQEKSHVHNPNLQIQLLLDYNQKSKLKLQEWSKLTADKKSLITIIFGQCNDTTRTEIALGTNYKNIVKMEILLTSSKGYKQFAMEAMTEVYPTNCTRLLWQ